MQIIVTYSGSSLLMYANGALVDTDPISITPSTNTGPLYIGQYYNWTPGNYFNGWVQQVKIWSVVLSSSDVTAEFNKKKACFGFP